MYTYNQLYYQYKRLYPKYLKKIIFILNKLHSETHGQDYWESIIGLYLRRYIQNYLFLKNISKNFYLNQFRSKDVVFFRNYREYSDFNNFSSINKLKFFKKINSGQFKEYKIKNTNYFVKINNALKCVIPNLLIKLNVTKVLFFESYFKKNLKIKFCLKSLFYFLPLPNLGEENYTIDKKRIIENRLRIIQKFHSEIKNDELLKNILISTPINYIENYETISNKVKKISLSNGIYTDGPEASFDFIKFYIARLKSNQKKILIGQHSLRSGIDDYDVFFDYSKSIASYFLSWGWKNNLNIVKKFSSLRIFSSLNKYKKNKDTHKNVSKICFILCGFSKIGESLCDNIIENKKAEDSRIFLLSKLDKRKDINIFLKSRSGSFLSQDNKDFYKKFNIFKDKTRLYEIFGKFSLLIFERLSLGIIECIYLNQPTVFFSKKNLYKNKNREFKELIFLLKKANIYFDDIKRLNKIIDNKDNITNWWYNKKNIFYRKKILQKFANSFEFKDIKNFKKLMN